MGKLVDAVNALVGQSQRRVRESEKRLRTVVSNAPILLFILNEKGEFTVAEGQGFPRLTSQSLINRSAKDVFGFLPQVNGHRTEVSTVTLHERIYEIRCSALNREGETSLRTVGIMTDITEQEGVRAAEREQRILAEALRDTAEALTSTLYLDEVVERISINVERIVPHDAALIMLIDHGVARVVRSRADTSHRLGLQEQRNVADVPWLAQLLQTGEPVVIGEIDNSNQPGGQWVQSFAGIPIYSDEQIIGVLCLYNEKPDAFTSTHIDHLKMFAGQASLAIRNAKYFEAERKERLLAQALQKTAETLSSSIELETTLDTSRRIFRFIVEHDQFALVLEPEYFKRLTAGDIPDQPYSSLYDCQEFTSFCSGLDGKTSVTLEDVQTDGLWRAFPGVQPETRAWMAIPLLSRGIITGVVTFGRSRASAFTHYDIQVARAFVQQIALALENLTILLELEMRLKELREAQRQLVRMTRLSTAGEIAAGVAHQINNPLTTIVAESYLALKKMSPEDVNYESLRAIDQAAHRAGAVVGRLLDLTRTSSYEMRPLDVNLSLQNAITLLQGQIVPHFARLEIDLASNLPSMEGSMQHLEDVWMNLLLNARDAMDIHKDNTIKIQSRYIAETGIIRVMVEDTGTGIDAQNLPHVFESFFTTKAHGTGLGLAICKEIIEHHGGTISVSSEKNRGTQVVINFKVR